MGIVSSLKNIKGLLELFTRLAADKNVPGPRFTGRNDFFSISALNFSVLGCILVSMAVYKLLCQDWRLLSQSGLLFEPQIEYIDRYGFYLNLCFYRKEVVLQSDCHHLQLRTLHL